jgi:hypothetical protein
MRKVIIAATTIAVLALPAISMASAYVPSYRVTSLAVATTSNCTSYVHNHTPTRGENRSFTNIVRAGSVTPGATVSGTLHHSKIDISGAYPNGYTWSYDGSLTGGTGSDSLGLKPTIAFTTTKSLINPITVTPYHVINNDVEWGPNSCSGLDSESDG